MTGIAADLTTFLNDRLDEDERYLKSNARHLWTKRPLREVEAKRVILAEHFAEDRAESLPGADCGVCYYIGAPGSPARWPCLTLRAVAAVYSDHPDYDPAWKPTA